MDYESDNNSVEVESILPYQSSVLSYIPRRYDRSLIVPSKLLERKYDSHANVVQLPPIKVSSTPSEEENFLTLRPPTTEGELDIFKQKFTRLRVALSQSHEVHRYAFEKVRKQKIDLRRTIHDQNKLTDQLLNKTVELNNKIKELRDEITKQCHKRDTHEMRQLKLRRTLNRLNKSTDQSSEQLRNDTKIQLTEQYNSYLSQLRNECNEELANRDDQIGKLKEKLLENFQHQANEHTKLLRAIEQAFSLENEKCEILQEYVDDYETNVYRAKKPCCLSSSYRLSRISTQLRLYLIIESTLNELFHPSCSCGQFTRCHQTFMRLHNK